MRRSGAYPTTPAHPHHSNGNSSRNTIHEMNYTMNDDDPIVNNSNNGDTTTVPSTTTASVAAEVSNNNAAIVRNIASFLSFSDAVSLTSFHSLTTMNHTNNNNGNNNIQQLDGTNETQYHHQDVPGTLPSSSSTWLIGDGDDFNTNNNNHNNNNSNNDDWSWYAAATCGTTNTIQSSSSISYASRQTSSFFDTDTPLTPALIAISPTGIENQSNNNNASSLSLQQQQHLTLTGRRQQHQLNSNTNNDNCDDYTNFVEDDNDDEYVTMEYDRHDDDNNQNEQQQQNRFLRKQYSQQQMVLSMTRSNSSFHDLHRMEELLQERRRRWAQEKITTAVFLHPKSLRSYCLDAYMAAKQIQHDKLIQAAAAAANNNNNNTNPRNEDAVYTVPNEQEIPETQIEPLIGVSTTSTTSTVVTNNHHYQKSSSSTSLSSQQKQQQQVQRSAVAAPQQHPKNVMKSFQHHKNNMLRRMIIHEIIDGIFRSVPISVLLDVLEAGGMLSYETIGASFTITITSLQHIVTTLANVICTIWDTITHCITNPFQVLEAIISLQFNAMGKTSEVLASGIQSVATGVGSASNMALYRLSATANMSSSTASLAGHFNRSRGSTGNNLNTSDSKNGNGSMFNKRLLQKLSAINNAALVVKYQESGDDACGLTRQAVSRTRRMMHYSVSLRPFVATVKLRPFSPSTTSTPNSNYHDPERSNGAQSPNVKDMHHQHRHNRNHNRDDSLSSSSLEDNSSSGGQHSPFMCTPQSFPPTPHSRQIVIAQRSQFSDDVVFLARDRLRVHDGLGSDNFRTRERSKALEEGKRLAIFACDKDSGIELTCGKHIATKGGDMYYASARSMVAVLRNCFVYFEFTVLPRLGSPPLATLAIGLSTEEMPPNTLVGAWQSSVGLCTTGQILMAGQWCSTSDPAKFSYGIGSTVGCLVCMDDDKAYETWDGVMIKASVRLNVNGIMVSPPVSTLPMSGVPGSLPIASSLPVGSAPSGRLGGAEKGPISPSSLQQGQALEIPEPTLTLLVPTAEDLYPTVTLQSPATSVVCRFSSEDVMATTREMIGAPTGVTVYAIDGSVILNDYEDVSS